MKNFELHVFSDLEELAHDTAERFISLSNDAIARSNRFSVALSGGSTPKAFHAVLAEPEQRERVNWSRCYFFWGDERFVPPDHRDSNYRMAKETLLSKVPVPDANIFRVVTEDFTPHDAAISYEETLRKFFVDDSFDLILLGMGEDGHTASLFPNTEALLESKRWVAENYVEKLQSHRITLTFPAINAAKNILFLISGAAKAYPLKEVLEGPHDPHRLPAQGVQPESGKITYLADRQSAQQF